MSNTLIQTKSILAKLLAGENINVVHQSGIATASFDLSARTMYLPIWENMDGDLYDMLTGHEVGHARWTPQEGWHTAIDERGRKFKSCMNVVEDARIEKLIKRKYPGLAKSFANAYRNLFDRDFFDHQPIGHGIVCHIQRIGITEINFMLARSDFVMSVFHFDAHIFQHQNCLFAQVAGDVKRCQIEVAAVIQYGW